MWSTNLGAKVHKFLHIRKWIVKFFEKKSYRNFLFVSKMAEKDIKNRAKKISSLYGC